MVGISQETAGRGSYETRWRSSDCDESRGAERQLPAGARFARCDRRIRANLVDPRPCPRGGRTSFHRRGARGFPGRWRAGADCLAGRCPRRLCEKRRAGSQPSRDRDRAGPADSGPRAPPRHRLRPLPAGPRSAGPGDAASASGLVFSRGPASPATRHVAQRRLGVAARRLSRVSLVVAARRERRSGVEAAGASCQAFFRAVPRADLPGERRSPGAPGGTPSRRPASGGWANSIPMRPIGIISSPRSGRCSTGSAGSSEPWGSHASDGF